MEMEIEMSAEQQEKPPQNKKYENQGLVGAVKKLYLDAKSSDIKFLFGSGDDGAGTDSSVVAHKSLLAAASDVFDAMFYGDLKEKGDIRLTDSLNGAFVEFLQFFYLNEVELTEENIAGVLYLGHKYNVTHCVNVCVQFLKDTLSAENVLVILDLATTYDHHELAKLCEKFIILDTVKVLKSTSFLDCNKKLLAHILKMEILSCSEVELFEACMSWVKAKSGQDEVLSREMVETHLGKLFYQIRFASMTMADVCILIDRYNSVLLNHLVTISKMITIPECQPLGFNTSPRQIKWNADAAIECSFEDGNEKPYFLDTKIDMIFSASDLLLLGGFTCGRIVRSKREDGKYLDLSSTLEVGVEVLEKAVLGEANGNVLLKMKAKLKSTDTKVILTRPILIRPGFFYKISLGPLPDDRIFFSEVLKTEMQIQSDTTIKIRNAIADCPEDISLHQKPIGLISSLDFNSI